MKRGPFFFTLLLAASTTLGHSSTNYTPRLTIVTAPSVDDLVAAGVGNTLKPSRLRKVILVPVSERPVAFGAGGGGQLTFTFLGSGHAFTFDSDDSSRTTFIKVGPLPTTPAAARKREP